MNLPKKRPPIMWGIPCDELSFSKFWIQFIGMSGFMPFDAFAFSEGTYLEKARNMIHSRFITSNAKYLMMLDSDVLFPPTMLETLLAHNLPIVGGWYRDKKSSDHHPAVYDFVKEIEGVSYWNHRKTAGAGLEKVDGTGAGCWLMSRETALTLGDEPYGRNIAGGGEDMKLCRMLMELNIPLHVDWNISCAHMGVGVY